MKHESKNKRGPWLFAASLCICLSLLYLVLTSLAASGTLAPPTVANSSMITVTYKVTEKDKTSVVDGGSGTGASVSGSTISMAAVSKSKECMGSVTYTDYTTTVTIAAASGYSDVYIVYEEDGQQSSPVSLSDPLVFSCSSSGSTSSSRTIKIVSVYQLTDRIVSLDAPPYDCEATATVTKGNGTSQTMTWGADGKVDLGNLGSGAKVKPTSLTYDEDKYVFENWALCSEAGQFITLETGDEQTLSPGTWVLSPILRPIDATAIFTVDGGAAYYYLDQAISAAKSTTNKKVILTGEGDLLLAGGTEVIIPAGVSFVLPYAEGATDLANTESPTSGFPYANYLLGSDSISATNARLDPIAASYLYLTLTVGEEYTIYVSGQLSLGGVIHSSSTVSSATAGARSNILLDGQIVVRANGILSVCGFIYGDGSVVATEAGAQVYQPFTICDFRGGGYFTSIAGKSSENDMVKAFPDPLMPFTQFTMRNIQTDLVMSGAATLYGYCNLYAASTHNSCTFAIAGKTGLVVLGATGVMTAEYNAWEVLPTTPWVGRTRLTIEGGASFGSMQMSLSMKIATVTVDTVKIPFSVPYNYSVTLKNGTFNIAKKIELLPGATFEVAPDAILNVSSHMAVYDQFDDTSYIGGMGSSGYTNSYSALVLYDSTYNTSNFNTRKTAEQSIWSKYLDDITAMYATADKYGCIYVGTKDGVAKKVTRWGEEVKVTTEAYTSGSKAEAGQYVSSATLVADPSVDLVKGYAIVPAYYMSAKGLVTPYESERFGGTVVEEYGVYKDGYSASYIYRVELEDGTYVYRWYLQPQDNITALYFFDAAGKFGYGQTNQNDEPGRILCYWAIDKSVSVDGVTRSYTSAVYYPYAYTGMPKELKNLLATGDKVVRRFYNASKSTLTLYEVQKADGALVYYYVKSGVAYEAIVTFDANNEYLNDVIYRCNGKDIVLLRNTQLYTYRDPYNTVRATMYFEKDGSTYCRYGSAYITTSNGVVATSAGTVTDSRWVPLISYYVPAVAEYVSPIAILDSTLLKDENKIPIGKDGNPITYENRSYYYTCYERRTPADGAYALTINGVYYGRVTYEFLDEDGEVCMYYVTGDSTATYYVWIDGTVVTASIGSYSVVNPATGKGVTFYVAYKVTKTLKPVYNAGVLQGELSCVSTARVSGASAKYPSADLLQGTFGTGSAKLVVNGTLNLLEGSTFGGLIQTDGGCYATVNVNPGAVMSVTTATGGVGYCYPVSLGSKYTFVGKTERTLKATILNYETGELFELPSATAVVSYRGAKTDFNELPYSYTLYYGCTAASSYTTSSGTISGVLEGEYLGGWYIPNAELEALTVSYRLNDYLWLNAYCTLKGMTVTQEDVENQILTINNGAELYVANGLIYVIKKIPSNQITDDQTFVITYDNGAVTKVVAPFSANLIDLRGTLTDEADKKKQELIDQLLKYGAAAKIYFDETLRKEYNASQNVAPELDLGSDTDASMGFTGGAATGVIGASLKTASAKVYFDEALRMSVLFKPTLPTGFDTKKIVKIGLLATSGTGTLTMANHETMYVLYSPTLPGTLGGSENYPSEDLKDAVNGTITDYSELPDVDAKGRWELCFDLTNDMYNQVYELRPFMIVEDETGTHYVYGEQVHYSLAAYISRTYKKSTDKAFKNLLMATWDYVVAAEAAFSGEQA